MTFGTKNGRSCSQRGDTIVEVLICMLIVSMILGGAYVTTRRSSTGIRSSQEHTEALKLIQSQIEQLRANATQATVGPNPSIFTAAQPFCMFEGKPLEADSSGKCRQNSSGIPVPISEQPAYRLTVLYKPEGEGTKFTIRADWDSLTGEPAYETIFYRLHQ